MHNHTVNDESGGGEGTESLIKLNTHEKDKNDGWIDGSVGGV